MTIRFVWNTTVDTIDSIAEKGIIVHAPGISTLCSECSVVLGTACSTVAVAQLPDVCLWLSEISHPTNNALIFVGV